jgi:hypothetical protein
MNQKEIIYLSVCVLVIYYLCRTRTESKYAEWYDYQTQMRPQSSDTILVNPNQSAYYAKPTATSSAKEGYCSF